MNDTSRSKLVVRAIQILVGGVLAYRMIFVTHDYVVAILVVAFVFVWSCRFYFEFRARTPNGGTTET